MSGINMDAMIIDMVSLAGTFSDELITANKAEFITQVTDTLLPSQAPKI